MMRTLLLLLVAIAGIFPQMFGASVNDKSVTANGVKLGHAKLSVMVHVLGNTDGAFDVEDFLKKTDIYVGTLSLFDEMRDERRTKMERDGAIYHVEVPVECIREVCGIRVCRNGEFVGGSQVLVNQNNVTGIRVFMSKDGNITSLTYLEGPTGEDWISAAGIIGEGFQVDPSFYVPKDKKMYDSWEAVRDYESSTLWPAFYEKCTSTYTLPASMSGWIVNNMKSFFASQCVLPYANNAKEYAHVTVSEPPMEAYSFLDSIDYNPDVFLIHSMMFSQRLLLSHILNDPCGGLEEIGETPVAEWQRAMSDKLKPAIKRSNKLLLDLLAGMSYVQQIDKGQPLSAMQIKNINEGFTDDIGLIVLARNNDRLKK